MIGVQIRARELEVSLFVEYIQNWIKEQIADLHNEMVGGLRYKSSKLYTYEKQLHHIIQNNLLPQYREIYERIIDELEKKIGEFFDIDLDGQKGTGLGNDVFQYHVNRQLTNEYMRTQRIAETIAGMMDKALDMTVFTGIENQLLKKAVKKAKIGKRIRQYVDIDGGTQKERHMRHLEKMLQGIHINISCRLQREMMNHYTELIYEIAKDEEEQELKMVI